jgi:Zn-dependent peptidase ImmA (M78 family)
MLIDREKAENAFRKVKFVREHYRAYILAPNMNVLSVEDLISVVASMYNTEIVRREVEFEAEFIRGMLLRYPDRAEIFVRRNLDNDLKRFTTVKEVCHIFLDEKEDWSPDGVQTITDLKNDIILDDELAKPTSQSETVAELAAMELMYPYECRAGDKAGVANGQQSISKIALHHKMPSAWVERALSTRYQELARDLWQSVNFEEEAAE